MTMITPSYLGETIEYSSLHACRSTLEDPTELRYNRQPQFKENPDLGGGPRGYIDAIAGLAMFNPLGCGKVAPTA